MWCKQKSAICRLQVNTFSRGFFETYTWVICWLVLHGPLDLCGEPPAAGHPALLMLACLVFNKQDEWSHIIVLFSVLGIGHFKTICTISQFNLTRHIVPTRGRPDSKEMFPDLEAAMLLLHIEGSCGRPGGPGPCVSPLEPLLHPKVSMPVRSPARY